MAPSSFILITLLSLAMVSGIAGARTAPFGRDKDITMAEAIKNLMHAAESTNSLSVENTRDCHTTNDNQNKGKVFVTDFEPRPNISTYPGNATTLKKDNFEAKPTVNPDDDAGTEKEFVKDF